MVITSIGRSVKRNRRLHDGGIPLTKEPRSSAGGERIGRENREIVDDLSSRIFKAVLRATARGIRELEVHCIDDTLFLQGRCLNYYTKQVAQQAAMNLLDGQRLQNDIRVL